jgi:hypothetical protein
MNGCSQSEDYPTMDYTGCHKYVPFAGFANGPNGGV